MGGMVVDDDDCLVLQITSEMRVGDDAGWVLL